MGRVIDYVNREVFDKPEEYYTLDKLRKAAAVDRRLTLREILEKVFGLIPRLQVQGRAAGRGVRQVRRRPQARRGRRRSPPSRHYFKAYVTSDQVRAHHRQQALHRPRDQPDASPRATSRPCPRSTARSIPEYIKDYVSLNQFAA